MFCIAILYSDNEGQRSYAKLNVRVHNAHAPIVIKLDCFLQPFIIEALLI